MGLPLEPSHFNNDPSVRVDDVRDVDVFFSGQRLAPLKDAEITIEEEKMDAVKNDQDKIQLELLSARWLLGVGRVLTFGAKKYAAHNWRKGLQQSRLLGATLRHVVAFLGGEDRDPETGLSHLYHASCCLMFASELLETRPDLDDRYRPEAAQAVSNAETGSHV